MIRSKNDAVRVKFNTSGTCHTQQSSKAECDINNILAKYQKTGFIDHVKQGGVYGDFDKIDYHDACNKILKAKDSFMELPSRIRKRFDNDPASFLDFVNNPDNVDEMKKLGILVSKVEGEEPVKDGAKDVPSDPGTVSST